MKLIVWVTFISFIITCFMAIITCNTKTEEVVTIKVATLDTFLSSPPLMNKPETLAPKVLALPDYKLPIFNPRNNIDAQIALFQEEKEKWKQIGALPLASIAIANYEAQLSAARTFISSWKTAYSLYPVATEIYYYLRYNMDLSQEVACGLLGHIMRESGGHSFDIEWWSVNDLGLHYGICQWDKRFYPEVWQQTLQTQLDFLAGNIEFEFEVFGRLYAPNFTYEDWKEIQSAEEAAVAFVTVYGRPLKHTKYDLKWRKQLACQAYNFFVGEMGL